MRAPRALADHKKADERFRALLETAPDAMVLVGQDGRIVLVNAQTEKLFGYAPRRAARQHRRDAGAAALSDQHPQHRAGYFADPKVRSMGSGLELHGLRKDGTEFPIEISLSPIETEDGHLVSSAIRDITERKQAEEKVAELNDRSARSWKPRPMRW